MQFEQIHETLSVAIGVTALPDTIFYKVKCGPMKFCSDLFHTGISVCCIMLYASYLSATHHVVVIVPDMSMSSANPCTLLQTDLDWCLPHLVDQAVAADVKW